jgi:hypothetical protein
MKAPDREPRRGGILGGLLITGVALAGIAVLCGVYVIRNVRVNEGARHGDVSIDIPGGRFEIHGKDKIDPSALGIPVYPGATWTKDSGGASFEWVADNDTDSKGFSVAGGSYTTQDDVDKVVDYYKQQLPSWLVIHRRNNHTEFKLKEGGYQRIVAISEKNGETRIGVAAIGKPESN